MQSKLIVLLQIHPSCFVQNIGFQILNTLELLTKSLKQGKRSALFYCLLFKHKHTQCHARHNTHEVCEYNKIHRFELSKAKYLIILIW